MNAMSGTTVHPVHAGGSRPFVYDRAPSRVYWELTRACDLACRHCRAEAIPRRDPGELDTAEGRRLLEELGEFGDRPPSVVLTGGDPLRRPDFWELLEHGGRLGLDMAVSPSGTPLLTPDVVRRLQQAGARAMSLSLDGSDAVRHDRFRGVPGCFARTVDAARAAAAAGLALQINSLVTQDTLGDLPRIGDLVGRIGATRWSLFFLIQVGRGEKLRQLSPAASERLMAWLWAFGLRTPAAVTTTEAPHFRRVALQRLRAEGPGAGDDRRAAIRRGFGIRDGNGVMFVSHRGDVQPSGFLPVVVGNVRTARPVTLYREAELFRGLRDTSRLRGRCGRCGFLAICGGSRARALATGGDVFGEDPLCGWEPGDGTTPDESG
jgi:AdoMet-dependent heme synthase